MAACTSPSLTISFGYPLEVLDEPGVGDRVGVHDLERDTLAELGDLAFVFRSGHVHRERHVERDHDRRRERGPAGLGTPHANLLAGDLALSVLPPRRGGASKTRYSVASCSLCAPSILAER